MKPIHLYKKDAQIVADLYAAGFAIDLSHIKRVIIEVHNYCNRSCAFCLNSLIDRRSSISYMENTMYENILESLKNMSFAGTLMFGRYHEPLSDDVIVYRVRQAASMLQGVRISLNTNGDYFKTAKMKELLDNGMSDMRVMIYLESNEKYEDNLVEKAIAKFAQKHDLIIEKELHIHGICQTYRVVQPELFKAGLTIHCENYGEPGYGCDRGGSISSLIKRKREISCYAPFFEINVDYNGMVLPCCNLLSDIDAHRKYILGGLKDLNLLQAYNSLIAKEFRSCVLNVESLPKPCQSCEYYWPNRTYDK